MTHKWIATQLDGSWAEVTSDQITADVNARVEAIRNSTDTLIGLINERLDALEAPMKRIEADLREWEKEEREGPKPVDAGPACTHPDVVECNGRDYCTVCHADVAQQPAQPVAACEHHNVTAEAGHVTCDLCCEVIYSRPATVADGGAGEGAMKALCDVKVIAGKDNTEIVALNMFFPRESARAILAAIRAGKVPGVIWSDDYLNMKQIAIYNEEIADLRERLAEAETARDSWKAGWDNEVSRKEKAEDESVDLAKRLADTKNCYEAAIEKEQENAAHWKQEYDGAMSANARLAAERDGLVRELETAKDGRAVHLASHNSAVAERDKALADLAAARESERRFRAEVEAGFRKHGLAAGPEVLDNLVRDLAAAKERADSMQQHMRDAMIEKSEANGNAQTAIEMHRKAVAEFNTLAGERDAARAEADAARAEVERLKGRKVTLPLMFGEPERGDQPDAVACRKMYDDAIGQCADAIRAAGVEVVS